MSSMVSPVWNRSSIAIRAETPSAAVVTLVGALCIALSACATEPAAPAEGLVPGYPRGWTGESPTSPVYDVGRDVALSRDGLASAYLRSLQTPRASEDYITLTQSIRADAFRGRRLQLSGYLRSTKVTGRGALWLRVDGPGTIPAFDNMADRAIDGSGDWRLVSIVADVPLDAIGISFGVVLNGSGELRADGLRLDIVGPTVAVTAVPLPDASAYDADVAFRFYAGMPLAPVNMSFEESAPTLTSAAHGVARLALPRDSMLRRAWHAATLSLLDM